MARILLVLALLTLGSEGVSAQTLRRVPAAVDYEYLTANLDEACNRCTALVMPLPKHGSSRLAIVRGVINGDRPAEAEIESTYFVSSSSDGKAYARAFASHAIDRNSLQDTDNSQVRTGKILKDIMSHEALSDSATVLLPLGGYVDASLLIRNATPRQFVVEQRSHPRRFAQNMDRLRTRAHSTRLTVFDFSPRSAQAMQAMKVNGTLKEWRAFSTEIEKSLHEVGAGDALARHSLEELEKRLQIPDGGVVIIYAHSDGMAIWLDTEEGIRLLGADRIRSIGAAAGGRLPPVILLSCQADSVLATEFVEAGSPLVFATDKPLYLSEATRYLRLLAKLVYASQVDIVDAAFDATATVNPYRLRALAQSHGRAVLPDFTFLER